MAPSSWTARARPAPSARRQILAAALDGKATAIQAEAFLEMNTKTEARALLRDNDVVYIFHNVIDKVGDSRRHRGEDAPRRWRRPWTS